MGCGCLVLAGTGWCIKDHRHIYSDVVAFSFVSLLLLFYGVAGGQNRLYEKAGFLYWKQTGVEVDTRRVQDVVYLTTHVMISPYCHRSSGLTANQPIVRYK